MINHKKNKDNGYINGNLHTKHIQKINTCVKVLQLYPHALVRAVLWEAKYV